MDTQFGFDDLGDLLPPQRLSAHGEQVEFIFGGSVNVSLTIDAMPGCGGLAWPAGEVNIAVGSCPVVLVV